MEEQLKLATEDAEHWQCIYEDVCQSRTDEQEELKFLREELQAPTLSHPNHPSTPCYAALPCP